MILYPECILLRRWSTLTVCLCLAFATHGQVFTSSLLGMETSQNPTSLAWGPDKRLYVLEVTGDINIYTITRSGPNNYSVTATETVSMVRTIQNHNDDGTVHVASPLRRQATGIVVTGTATTPVVYVTSSDYRVGGGWPVSMGDKNLDTNSGVISRLTKNGSTWSKVDLIRGLPRSEENHAVNGMFLDEENHMLYVAVGGHTNGGAPSSGFAFICEFALSAAILMVDLNMIDTMPVLVDTSSGASYVYNLPTVDDPTRSNANGIDDPMDPDYDGVDIHDPFGGNDGLNQARLVEGGPVQIFATGFRNPYDVVITRLGHVYAWDNGPNIGWGGPPNPEGYGIATNNYPAGEPGSLTMNDIDCLHKMTEPGYYAGHPNPIRGNPDSAGLYTYSTFGVWRTEYLPGDPANSLPYDWPPIPFSMANPIEGDFQAAGVDNEFIYSFYKKSMNGICEYTASHFNGAMSGDLLTTGFNDGRLYRIRLNENGDIEHPDSVTVLASGLVGMPLDVVAIGDEPPFPGTIWLVSHISGGPIYVFEPAGFFPCTGTYSYLIDEDGDLYSNADEIDNGVNPCNPSDKPADFDMTFIGGFLVSNLNDPDDDDDGIPDTTDFFVWDATNGISTVLPLEYPLLNADPGFGFYGLGFTGLMMNGTSDYLELWLDENNSGTSIVAGGASGRLTIVAVDTGDALGNLNTQTNAFQFGIPVDSTDLPFLVESVLAGPVFPEETAVDYRSAGIFVGTGDQDNYVKIVVNANGGNPGIEVVVENDGVPVHTQYNVPGVGDVFGVRLGLVINPANGFVRAQYSMTTGPLIDLGDGFYVQGDFLEALKGPQAVATGVIATSRGTTGQFVATWDHIRVEFLPETSGHWYLTHDGNGCQSSGPGPCCYPRHECAFVQSGDKFYLLGGREFSSNVNIYDPETEIWSIGAAPDSLLHHFQAVDYYGMIIAAGAFRGGWPEEKPLAAFRVYNPLTNTWHLGPSVPAGRRRGSAGVVVQNDTMYIVGGITNGHISGAVKWLDRYDMRNNTWTTLPDAPKARDHFHAAIINDKIYAAAGRRTALSPLDSMWLSTEPRVDVYDLPSNTWSSLDALLPTQRAGNAVAVLNDELIVIGGEREAGLAKKTTEAYDPVSESWRTLDSLHIGRHGTQAIVNNGGIYIATGATMRGGSSTTRTTEAFYLYGETDPILTPTVASALTSPGEDFGEVRIMEDEDRDMYIYNTGGNQAILIHSMSLMSGVSFSVTTPVTFPRFLKPGDSLRVQLRFAPTAIQAYSDTLVFNHTGSNGVVTKFALNGDGIYNWLGTTRAYVDSSVTGNELGQSWTNAFKTLTRALQVAGQFPQITEVWIAKGTYFPGNMRSNSFTLRDSLHVYGGFHGTEILLSQRDIDGFPVILSGDIGTPGDASDNVYHVVVMTGTADTAVLDGVIIHDGHANGSSGLDKYGAGVLNFGKLAIRNSQIRSCISVDPGSAIFNSGATALLHLQNILLSGNSDPHVVNRESAILIWRDADNVIDND